MSFLMNENSANVFICYCYRHKSAVRPVLREGTTLQGSVCSRLEKEINE